MKFKSHRYHDMMDDEIASLLEEMAATSATSEEYETLSSRLESLSRARNQTNGSKLDMRWLAGLGVTVLQTAMILHFEKTGVIGSKSFSLIRKPQV